MSAKHVYGEPELVTVAVDSAVVVDKGELVYQATDDARPADALAWSTNLAGTQEAFHDAFLGVAAASSRDGDTDPINVATRGRFEFDCAAATFQLGALVGPADSGSDTLMTTKVVAVATANLAIGRVAKQYSSNTTRVIVDVVSTVMHGGPQAAA